MRDTPVSAGFDFALRRRRAAGLALAPLALLVGLVLPVRAGDAGRDIIETIRAAGTLSTLASALEATDLGKMLQQPGPFTLIAPTDEAFARLPPDEFAALLVDRERLDAVMRRHIIMGKVAAADLAKRTTVDPIQGDSLHIAFGAYGIKIEGASVLLTDLAASNGVVHVIDAVLPLR